MGVVHNDENKNGDRRYPRGMNHGNESPESIAAQRIRAIFSVSIRLVTILGKANRPSVFLYLISQCKRRTKKIFDESI